jgi:hypothetical protein
MGHQIAYFVLPASVNVSRGVRDVDADAVRTVPTIQRI